MDVYFIPVAPNRHELYCEHGEDPQEGVGEVDAKGRFAAIFDSFKEALARAERERVSGAGPSEEGPRSWSERMKDRMLGWIAEKIAEQRLLWRLRNETAVSLHYPDDTTAEQALSLAKAELQREADRHFKWMIIDGVLFVASGAFFLVPGPNLIAYYFGFRLVGHYLSRRGAVHALQEVSWNPSPSAELSRLRRVLKLPVHEREREVHEVASALRLPHLAKFFERISINTA